MNTIFYLSHYTCDLSIKQNRVNNFAASQKINYVTNTLIKNNFKVKIISPTWLKSFGYKNGFKIIKNNLSILFFPTLSIFDKFGLKIIKVLFSHTITFLYLIFSIKINDTLIVYHSLDLLLLVKIIKLIKRVKIIYEIEEIYSDIQTHKRWKKFELKAIKDYSYYILSTELLLDYLDISSNNKKYTILYGDYTSRQKNSEAFNDNLIHIVYAGTLDPIKGGAKLLLDTSLFLSDKYFIHILGFGSKEQISNLQNDIQVINSNLGTSKIKYEGVLINDNYYNFLSKCQIGFSCQDLINDFNNSSFPSKILVYLSLGLSIVSSKNIALVKSKIAKFVSFSPDNNPKNIAHTIKSIKPFQNSNRILNELNINFEKDLLVFLKL